MITVSWLFSFSQILFSKNVSDKFFVWIKIFFLNQDDFDMRTYFNKIISPRIIYNITIFCKKNNKNQISETVVMILMECYLIVGKCIKRKISSKDKVYCKNGKYKFGKRKT